MRAHLAAGLGGLSFGAGLGVAGMTRPEKVLGFLDVAGAWDASLAFVMLGGVAVHAALYRLIRRRRSPLFGAHFHVPGRRDLDRPLLAGAALFGVGWGLAGYCPGPGLVSAAAGRPEALLFVAAMTFGMLVQHATARRPGGAAPSPREPAGPAPPGPSPQGG
jgi:hypothetical protein